MSKTGGAAPASPPNLTSNRPCHRSPVLLSLHVLFCPRNCIATQVLQLLGEGLNTYSGVDELAPAVQQMIAENPTPSPGNESVALGQGTWQVRAARPSSYPSICANAATHHSFCCCTFSFIHCIGTVPHNRPLSSARQALCPLLPPPLPLVPATPWVSCARHTPPAPTFCMLPRTFPMRPHAPRHPHTHTRRCSTRRTSPACPACWAPASSPSSTASRATAWCPTFDTATRCWGRGGLAPEVRQGGVLVAGPGSKVLHLVWTCMRLSLRCLPAPAAAVCTLGDCGACPWCDTVRGPVTKGGGVAGLSMRG